MSWLDLDRFGLERAFMGALPATIREVLHNAITSLDEGSKLQIPSAPFRVYGQSNPYEVEFTFADYPVSESHPNYLTVQFISTLIEEEVEVDEEVIDEDGDDAKPLVLVDDVAVEDIPEYTPLADLEFDDKHPVTRPTHLFYKHDANGFVMLRTAMQVCTDLMRHSYSWVGLDLSKDVGNGPTDGSFLTFHRQRQVGEPRPEDEYPYVQVFLDSKVKILLNEPGNMDGPIEAEQS